MQGHRGSSPQIRAFGPDGRSTTTGDGNLFHFSRASSPLRAISLDARCPSPASTDTSEPSPSCLATLASSTTCASTMCISPKLGRCLSPLLLPPKSGRKNRNYFKTEYSSFTSLFLMYSGDPSCGPASPLGAIQPDLYQRPEGPVYIKAPDASISLGKLHFKIKYDSNVSDLAVHLIEAHSLCPIDDGGFRDPFVRLIINPDVDNRKRESNIHRGECHPFFDQNFKFPVSKDQLNGKVLILQVLDCDRYSHNDVMGEVRIKIDEFDLSKSVEVSVHLFIFLSIEERIK